MTKAEHILGIIKDSKTEEESKQRIEEFLKRDYTPKNSAHFCPGQNDLNDIVDIQPALPGMRCAHIIGDDWPQSGYIYCGKPAYIYGWSKKYPEICYMICESCANRHGIKINA